MDSLNVVQLSKKNSRESDVPSTDERDSSPTRKSSKAKQKKKTSTGSLKDHEKSKRRASKGRHSMAQTTQEINEALSLAKKLSWKSSNDDAEHNDDDCDEAGDHFGKLTLEEKAEAERLQQNQATKYSIGNFSMTNIDKPKWMQEPDEKNVILENRLENDNEFDVTGILNLSSMNVTDNDLPAVIQRAFWAGPKKCTGLILRDNALTADGVRMIVDTILAGRTPLKHLSLASNPDIGDAGIEHIVRLLKKSQSIIFLALTQTGMTDRGVRLLADVLCGADPESTVSSRLEKLYISFNKAITDESLEPIFEILGRNRKLKVLSLEHCSFSDKAHQVLEQLAIQLKKKKFSLTG